MKRRTPVRAPDDSVVPCCASGCRATRNTKVGKLDGAIFSRQDVSVLDVAVNDALIVQIHETVEDLRDMDSYVTRFSGNFLDRLKILCKDPFLQNLGEASHGTGT